MDYQIFSTIFNLMVIAFYLYFFILTRNIYHTTKRVLKERSVTIEGNKITPILVWEDKSITYCKVKDLNNFVVGKEYEITYQARIFINPFKKKNKNHSK